MSRNILNIALAALLCVIIYYLVQHHESLFGGSGLLPQQQVDSIMGAPTAQDGQHRRQASNAGRHNDRPLDDGITQPDYELFTFDPNTADTTALLRLGFPRWMIRNILRYRAAGGRYQYPEDVKAIYGMTPELYERIEPYIQIDRKFRQYNQAEIARERKKAREREQSDSTITDSLLPYPKIKSGEHININTADDSTLRMIPGIGEQRAKSIIFHRNRLGGFISVEQVREIDGIPDSCLKYMETGDATPQRINLNTATLSTMQRHPYIGKRKAAAIYNYRRMYGRINSLDDLRLHPDLSPEQLQPMLPYITLE